MRFRTALLIAMIALVTGIVGAVAIAVASVVERSARERLADDLARSHGVVAEAWAARRALEGAQSRVVAEEPRLKAVVATADISHATIIGVCREINRGLDADVFLVTDADGFLAADVAHPADEGDDLRGLPVVREALEHGSAEGILVDDDAVYRVNAQRLAFGETTVGVLVVGNSIDDALASSLEAATGTAFVALLGDRVVASSRDALTSNASALAPRMASLVEAPRELEADGSLYLASAETLHARTDGEPLQYVLLASLDRALDPSRRLINLLYALAAIAIAVGAGVALLLSLSLTRPLSRMVAFAGRVATGDLTARASTGGLQELRELGGALDQMVVDLRRSRDAIASQERLEKELEIASRLQTALLPRSLDVPELDIAARMIPATEVGGDYYDVLPRDGRGSWLAVGDVAGHGLPAGIVMLMVRTGFAALVSRDPDANPSELVTRLNHLLHECVRDRLRSHEHVTMCVLRHDGDGKFVYAGAHEDIVIWRHATRRCERIRTQGAWLAMTESIERVTKDAELVLERGDVMLLMTDGVFEGERADGTILGIGRVLAELEALDGIETASPEKILEHVIAFVSREVTEQADDVSLMVVRRRDEAAA